MGKSKCSFTLYDLGCSQLEGAAFVRTVSLNVAVSKSPLTRYKTEQWSSGFKFLQFSQGIVVCGIKSGILELWDSEWPGWATGSDILYNATLFCYAITNPTSFVPNPFHGGMEWPLLSIIVPIPSQYSLLLVEFNAWPRFVSKGETQNVCSRLWWQVMKWSAQFFPTGLNSSPSQAIKILLARFWMPATLTGKARLAISKVLLITTSVSSGSSLPREALFSVQDLAPPLIQSWRVLYGRPKSCCNCRMLGSKPFPRLL